MTSTTKLTLGEKIRNFRKRAGMSQLDLEAAIQTSPGVISRIEAGKVNPTKETLLQIAGILELDKQEVSDLLEIRPLYPTPEEIETAITECKSLLSRDDLLAYLLDDAGRYVAVSNGFINLLNAKEEQVKQIIGSNFMEVALDPKYGIMQFLDFEMNKKIYALELARMIQESRIALESIPESLTKLDGAAEVLQLMQSLSIEELLDSRQNHVYFDIDGKKIRYTFTREKLKGNNRFELIEFFDPLIVE